MVLKYEAEIEELRKQLMSRQAEIHERHSSKTVTITNSPDQHYSVLQSQLSEREEVSKVRDSKFFLSENTINHQI